MRRLLLVICVLLMLAAACGWVAGRWRGTIELWNWRISQEITLLGYIRSDSFLVWWERTYQLRVNEQPPPDREINAFLFKWRRSCPTITYASGQNLPGWTGEFPTVVSEVEVPLWTALLMSGLYPAVAIYRGPIRRWRRGRAGCCRKCGYDLTGNVSGVCPECGERIEERSDSHANGRGQTR